MKVDEAKRIQLDLASRVVEEDTLSSFTTIGGMDVSQNLYDPAQMIYAAVVTLSYPDLQVIDSATVAQKQTFPYIPGLLGFREAPALVEAFEQLTIKPQILLVDGHGISHPRRLGIASHVGVVLDLPTIGVAKSILVGKPEGGSLIWNDQKIGAVLQTKKRSNPLFISVGHKITLPSAVRIVKSCLRGYRLPEPTRQAHLAANRFRKKMCFVNSTAAI